MKNENIGASPRDCKKGVSQVGGIVASTERGSNAIKHELVCTFYSRLLRK
jgi:hypothetical protein